MTALEWAHRRRLSLALGTSVLAWGCALPSNAQAQCAPDPTVTNGSSTCTGTDTNGIRVTTNATTLTVASGARVTNTGAAAIAVEVPASTTTYNYRVASVLIGGTVDGGTQAGISLLSGGVAGGGYDPYGTRSAVTVMAGALVTGTSGIIIGTSLGNNSGYAIAGLDNGGTISGSGGVALLSSNLARGGFDVISNAATGSIGAIVGTVGRLSNAGLIDGATRSAVDQTTTYDAGPTAGVWTNSGTIRSSSNAATIANLGQLQPLTNSGTISNAGTGAAVQGSSITIINVAGGRIATSGGTAIAASSQLSLTNAGVITGNVTDVPAQGTGFYATVDSTAGRIMGNVTLGIGNDLVYALYNGSATLVTGITGTLDAGAGTNSVVLAPAADLRIATAVTLPTSFQRLRLAPASGATVTLTSGFVAPGTIELAGAGTIRNEATITTNGQAFLRPYYVTNAAPNFINAGGIQATVTQGLYAIDLGATAITNSGTIAANGNGVAQSGGTLLNTGSVIASGTAIEQFSSALDNRGLIRSSSGTAVQLTGSVGNIAAVNTGRIEGATYGAVTSILLNNSGTIAATGMGTAVGLSSDGVLNNLEGGVISGGAYAITGVDPYGSTSVYNSTVFNAGTINGNVTFLSSQSSVNNANNFVALPGGILNGNLALGRGDTLVTDLANTGTGLFAGISGTVTSNGGLLRYRVTGQVSAVLGPVGPFATAGYELVAGASLVLKTTAPQTLPLILAGNGTVDVTADFVTANAPALAVVAAQPTSGTTAAAIPGLAITSHGTLTITRTDQYGNLSSGITLSAQDSFVNAGTINVADTTTYASTSAGLAAVGGGASVTNTGSILLAGGTGIRATGTVINTGVIRQAGSTSSLGIVNVDSLNNSGTIDVGANAVQGSYTTVSVTNSGTIASRTDAAIVGGYNGMTITNLAGGVISGGTNQYAIRVSGGSLTNAGTINGNVSLDYLNYSGPSPLIADNAGTINGTVTLGHADDYFIQRAGGIVSGLVDGGAGTNMFVVDATGGTATLAASGIANFASVTQTGTGIGVYSGTFAVGTIALAGGTLTVATGQSLATTGATTVTGIAGSGNLAIVNGGTIAGGITLADGNDTVVNNGTIGGRVQLGSGDDTFVEGVGSTAQGGVDGGTGTNLYRVVLAGDRTGIGARSNFQNLAVDGCGTLGLVLDQSFGTVTLSGTGLALTSGTYTVGQIIGTGSTGVTVTLDRDLRTVQLGAGNDTLATTAPTLAGRYDGGAGTNTLRLLTAGPVTLSGSVTGFQAVSLAGGALTVSGTLGSTGATLAFSGNETITVARGGTLAGAIDLGAGVNGFRLAAGGTLAGTVSGGTGASTATLDLSAGDYTLRAGTLTRFQRLVTEGSGTLTLAGGALSYAATAIAGNLTVGADASLSSAVAFGAADNHLVIAGGFVGSVDGGAGSNSIDVAGGSAAAPVAFSSIANEAVYRQSAGFATVSGMASLGSVALTGGRLVGLAGSTLAASGFTVGQGATFGSAGTVNGTITVAGILSPGASPGTMTVNGNVALGATSVSLFEITPAVSDKLVVNGAVSIASGATLQLVPSGNVTPGASLDLVTATGGITGSFTTITKPASLFGFVVQDANRIRLLGEFLNDAAYTGQVRRSVDYVNDTLVGGRSSAALLAAVPLLVTTSGGTNAAAFAQLTPEAYAAARQIGTENGLTLSDAARGAAFAPNRDTPGLYTFASTLGSTRTLEVNDERGTARTTTNGYGFLGGIGVAGAGWSLGAFGGYLNDHQSLAGLGARTMADGAVAGVHGRAHYRAIGFRATLAYDDAHASTRRVVPGGTESARYALHSWVADASIDATLALAGGWSMRPSVGGTAIRTTRDGVTETGSSAFALTVAGRRTTATFVDGGVTFARDVSFGTAGVRPYLTIGARYQAEGRTPYALAGFGGGAVALLAAGAPRAPLLATAKLGADVALSPRLALFGAVSGESGDSDRRASAQGGLRLAF